MEVLIVQVDKKRKGRKSEREFNVLVLSTMSAGKTSFVNALIGQELLHSGNEATTACITSVRYCRDRKDFSGACYSYSGLELARQENVTSNSIRKWNADSEVKNIQISGSFHTVSRSFPGMVLHDTPGPNNSQTKNHALLMTEAIRVIPFDTVFYLLNASQLATADDRFVLENLLKEFASKPKRPIYFILNKVDLLDPEKGEDVADYVRIASKYLIDIGFQKPNIIPVMANIALYARKALSSQKLTRAQNLRLNQTMADFRESKRDLLHAALIPSYAKEAALKSLSRLELLRYCLLPFFKNREKNNYQQLITISGLKTIEIILRNQYEQEVKQ